MRRKQRGVGATMAAEVLLGVGLGKQCPQNICIAETYAGMYPRAWGDDPVDRRVFCASMKI